MEHPAFTPTVRTPECGQLFGKIGEKLKVEDVKTKLLVRDFKNQPLQLGKTTAEAALTVQ